MSSFLLGVCEIPVLFCLVSPLTFVFVPQEGLAFY